MKYIKAILAHPFRFKRCKDGLDIGIFWIIALLLFQILLFL